jgi:4-alpha-glucanotransferase
MVVMQFAIRPWPTNPHRLENHRENLVVYTGTHDHNTAVGWWETLPAATRRRSGLDPRDPAWSLIEAAFSSPARLAIVPAQDVLSLGAEARLNTPGRSDGNWSWRLRRGQLTDELAARLRAVTEQHRRLG